MERARSVVITTTILIASLVPSLMLAPAATAAEPEPRIVVGPDHLVTRDGEFPHVEPMVATHPDDPTRLLASSIVFPRPDRDSGCRTYVSEDGGSLWRVTGEDFTGAADPQVAFTPRGTALSVCLTEQETADGRTSTALGIDRSPDGGLTWDDRLLIQNHSFDHPQIAVDATAGPRAGAVYLGVLYFEEREYTVGVLRSTDDGRSFVGPVEVARGGPLQEGRGLNVTGVGVLSDGTLLVNFLGFSSMPGDRSGRRESGLFAVRSTDGGETFSTPVRTATVVYDPPDDGPASRLGGFASWAVDGVHDRVYQTWSDWSTGASRVLMAASADGGRTWGEPVAVDPAAPPQVHQFLPTVAVNASGHLGVSWSTTRFDGTEAGDLHRQFTASVDGAATFLPSRRLSSAPSRPQTPVNQRPVLAPFDDGSGTLPLVFVSAYARWPEGGDYAGLAADADGTFHAVWPDTRSEAFQLWSATARVERSAPPEPPAGLVVQDVTERIRLVSDPAVWDPETREIRVPLRLQNVSDSPVYPPLVVEVTGLGWGSDLPEEMAAFWREREATLVDADNGEPKVGARFDYTDALGDLESLPPGGLTGARLWRIHQPESAMPPVRVEVRGRVPSPP